MMGGYVGMRSDNGVGPRYPVATFYCRVSNFEEVMTRKSICMLTLACFFLSPLDQALAHSGRTDSDGCHQNTLTGERHCHTSKNDDNDVNWAVVGGVAGGALLLWLLVKWLDRDETEAAEGLRLMPYAAEGNRIGIAGEYSLGGPGAIGLRAMTPEKGGRGTGHVGAYWRLKF